MIINRKVIILGAGLTGLSAAYYLRNESVELTILEARDRTGGRIHTVRKEDEAPVEMGATWLGRKHRDLIGLLEELNLPIFEQRMSDRAIYQPISTSPPQLVTLPPNDDPTFRIGGGSGRLIDTLTDSLPAGTIRLGTIVTALRLAGEAVIITTNRGDYRADCVISTLPPHLFVTTISVEPALPPDLLALTARTHTWMGESIKVALTYAEPFWRAPGSSGTVFSSPGPATELYDHSTVEDDRYALKGFFSGAYAGAGREQRLELLLRQLATYYGPAARSYLSYTEAVWGDEPFTYRRQTGYVAPHQHNGDPRFRQPLLNGRLFLAGTETASAHPGYMDGAVRSGREVVVHLVARR